MEDNKYAKGKIYKITDIGYNKCYYGSTCEKLSARMAKHRSNYKSYLDGDRRHYVSSFQLFDEFGIENCKIELVEHYACNNKDELLKQEGYHIQHNECINKKIAGRSIQQYNEDNKDHRLEYFKKILQG